MKPSRLISFTLAALTLSASQLLAAPPIELAPGVRLEAAGLPIDDHKLGHFVPTVADWNGDGKKDLIVGSFSGDKGNVYLYLNVGTDQDPKFDKPTLLEANGQPIRLTGG